jgi:O-antigen/teichoic acid export membrane protein
MMANSESKTVVRHGLLYGLANLVNRSAGLILLPVYTHVLTPQQFGVYASLVLVTDLVSVIVGLGLGRALLRLYIEREEQSGKGEVVGTALVAFGFVGLVIALLAYPIGLLSNRLLFNNDDTAWLFAWAIWALIPTTLFNLQLNYIVALKKSSFYAFISAIKATLFIILNLWLVVFEQLGVFGIILSTLVAITVVVAILLVNMARTLPLRFSMSALVDLLRYGGPLVPTILLDTVQFSIDRYVVGPMEGAIGLGYYGLGLRVASLLKLFVIAPFLQIWNVRQLEELQEGNTSSELPRIFFRFMVGLMSLCVAISLFKDIIIQIIASDAYAPAASVLPWLVAVQVVIGLRSFSEIGLLHAKKTASLIPISLISLCLAIPTYWLVVTLNLGITGVAAACLAQVTFRTCLTLYWADRHSSIVRMFPWGRFMLASLVATACVISNSFWTMHMDLLTGLLARLGMLSVFLIFAVALIWRTDHVRSDADVATA